LLFFNIGIELGQLAFIAVLLLFARLVSRWPISSNPVIVQSPVLLLGVLSAMWCFERGLAVIAG
jgi:hypothetical protein